jgi:hypothetical protein
MDLFYTLKKSIKNYKNFKYKSDTEQSSQKFFLIELDLTLLKKIFDWTV